MTDGLAQPQRSLAFATIAMALFVAVLDSAVANIALPPITMELGIEPVDAIWIVNAYQLAVTVALLPLASLGEIVGYRKVYIGGLAIFTLASLFCALSGSLPELIAARALQGLGAAGVMSINMALVRFVFPHAMLGRAVGYVAMIVGISSAAGPSIAGAILAVAPWQMLFLVNLPVGVLALVVGSLTLPHTPRAARRFDFKSAALSAATFGLVISGVNALGHSEGLGLALLQIVGGICIGIVFVRHQLGLAAPMLPVDLLARPIFALSATTSVCSFSAQGLAFVTLPFLLHDQLDRSASETGLLMTPWPIATAAAAFIAGRLADRFNPGKLSALGLALFAAGLVSLALMSIDPTDADLLWRLVLSGFGFGLFQTPNNKVLITSAPRERSGGASGIQSSARLVGQSMGVAFAAVIFGLLPDQRFVAALGFAAFLAAAGIVPSWLRRPPSAASPIRMREAEEADIPA
ncbi:MFS transporter [Aureimonas psammosilenae]|uniref:MFS transporter n=1 Tax=Aureimonas psammosilenae TaxID=2495496 RepID=UPI00186AA051|nr:MFS transporter [Aureimonas psammosilenae]